MRNCNSKYQGLVIRFLLVKANHTVQTETRAEILQRIAQVDGAVGILEEAFTVASLVSGELGEHHVSEAAYL